MLLVCQSDLSGVKWFIIILSHCLRPSSHRHNYESRFWFTSDCFANKTAFHFIVSNFTNCAPLAVNNSTMTLILMSLHIVSQLE